MNPKSSGNIRLRKQRRTDIKKQTKSNEEILSHNETD